MSASNPPSSKHKSRHQYPPEMRERAVRMVLETIKETGERHGVVTRVGLELGIGSETLRHWVKKAEVEHGLRPGVTTADRQRIVELEKENRELRRANVNLKTAFAFFARVLDPLPPKCPAISTFIWNDSRLCRNAGGCLVARLLTLSSKHAAHDY